MFTTFKMAAMTFILKRSLLKNLYTSIGIDIPSDFYATSTFIFVKIQDGNHGTIIADL